MLALGVAVPVQAQSTSCQWLGSVWTCNHSLPPAPQGNVFDGWGRLPDPSAPARAFEDGFDRGRERRRAAERAELERQRIVAETNAWEAARRSAPSPSTIVPQDTFIADVQERQRIGEMLRNGNCVGAIDRALVLGDIQLVTNVKASCAGAEVKPRP